MSASHHDREEETLIAYFQQMLADVDDQEFDGELQAQGGDLKAAPAAQSVYSAQANHNVLSSANEAIKSSHESSLLHEHAPVSSHATAPVTADAKLEASSEAYGTHSKQEVEDSHDYYGYERPDDYANKVEPQLQPQLATQVKSETALDYAPPSDSHSLQRLLATVGMHSEPEEKVVTKLQEPEVQVATEPVKVEVAPAIAQAEAKVEVAPAIAQAEAKVEAKPAAKLKDAKDIVKTPQQLAQERMAKKLEAIAAEWKNVDLGEQFQVLFFLVQGVRFAVPLIDLGGIFECEKTTQLFGKPSWFMGITDVRGDKINIVDTLRWVMPEINDSPDKYPYLISLGSTDWSIGCDVLEGNRTLNKSQIKWREIPGNRPWLAGIVTSDKCAVLHVQSLISLFEAGADIEDLNKNLKSEKQK